MSSKAPTLKQLELIVALQKQIGLDAYHRIKTELRLPDAVMSLSRFQVSQLIKALLDYKNSSKRPRRITPDETYSDEQIEGIRDMEAALESLLKKLKEK